MKPVYFPIMCAAVAHPGKGATIKLQVREGVLVYMSFG